MEQPSITVNMFDIINEQTQLESRQVSQMQRVESKRG